jgi:transglutaminase-like putative cysteine protease
VKRRDLIYALGGVALLKTGSITSEWASFASDPSQYIQPHHTAVEQQAEAIDGLPETAELSPELTYKRDGEILKSASRYLEEGTGDCEDHCFLAASILENKQIPWKAVFETGHTEAQFKMDDTYYRWHVGKPETPVERGSRGFDLMYDLENGWDKYTEDWDYRD